jgi:glycyl-tRNA synthetase
LTVDHQTLEDNTVTIRDRDTTKQERISVDEALAVVKQRVDSF